MPALIPPPGGARATIAPTSGAATWTAPATHTLAPTSGWAAWAAPATHTIDPTSGWNDTVHPAITATRSSGPATGWANQPPPAVAGAIGPTSGWALGPSIDSLTPDYGPIAGGTTVAVVGHAFAGWTDVTVAGVSVAGTVYTDAEHLSFVTPPHAFGPVTVQIVTPNGTASATFTYYAPCTVSSVLPSAGPTAGGQTVTVTGTGFTDATGVLVDGDPVTIDTITGDTELTFTTPPHAAATVNVQVVPLHGSTSSPTSADLYTYVPTPTITSITPDNGPSIGGTTVTIEGTNLSIVTEVLFGGDAGFALTTALDGLSLTVRTPTHTVGLVDVEVVAGPVSATATDAYTFTNAPPVAIAAGTPLTGDAILAVAFNANGSYDPDGGTLTYLWNFGDGNTSTWKNPYHSYATPDTYDVYLVVTDETGTASADLPAAHLSIVVTERAGNIPPVPLLLYGPTAGDAPMLVSFYAYLSNDPDGTIISYTYDFGDGSPPVTTGDFTTHIYTTPGVYSMTLTVTDNNGASTTSAPFEVIVNTPPGPPDPPVITSIRPDAGGTAGGTVVTLKGTGFLSADEVKFGTSYGGIVHIVSDVLMTVVAPPHDPGQVHISVHNPGGWSGLGTEDLFTYSTSPVAFAEATPNPTTTCSGPPLIQFTGSASGGVGPYRYFWDFGDGSSINFGDGDTSDEQNPEHYFYGNGAYLVTLTVTDRLGAQGKTTLVVHINKCPGPPNPNPGDDDPGGGNGSDPGGGGGGSTPGGGPGNPPDYIDYDCTPRHAHYPGGLSYAQANPNPYLPSFVVGWTVTRLLNGVRFVADVIVTAPIDSAYEVFFGAVAMTADGNFPTPSPSATTASQYGYGSNRQILSASTITLTPAYTGGMFTPRINGGAIFGTPPEPYSAAEWARLHPEVVLGITTEMTGTTPGVYPVRFSLTVTAPIAYEIALAQLGFANSRHRSISDVAVAWVAVDCTPDEIEGGWVRNSHTSGGLWTRGPNAN